MQQADDVRSAIPSNRKSSLDGCLIDGDMTSVSCNRQQSRKAFGLSLAIEIAALAVLVVAPLMRSIAQPKLVSRTFVPFVLNVTHPRIIDQHPTSPIHSPAIRNRINAIKFPVNGTPRIPTPVPADPGGDGISEGVLVEAAGVDELQLAGLTPLAPPEAAHHNFDKQAETKVPLRLSEALVQAQLISRVEPKYPPIALVTRTQGVVKLHAIISRDGNITELEVLSGHPLLIQAALDAVKQWRYRATLLHGQPVEVETTITVVFQLRQ